MAQRELTQQGFEPKKDIRPTQNLYDMVEPQPKYLINEKEAEPIEEMTDEKIANTKLAKALKEVPLLKPNQLTKPSISELFFAKMGEE